MSIEAKVSTIVAQQLNVNDNDIKPTHVLDDSSPIGHTYADPLDLAEIWLVLEDAFDIEVDESYDEPTTVQHLVNCVRNSVRSRPK